MARSLIELKENSAAIIIAIDLDDTIYDPKIQNITHLVNLQRLLRTFRLVGTTASALKKGLHVCVITAKNYCDDLVADFQKKAEVYFPNNVAIYCVGNHDGQKEIAKRKVETLEYVANKFSSNLGHTIFIDDNQVNISYAKCAGANCILAHNNFAHSQDPKEAKEAKTIMIINEIIKIMQDISKPYIIKNTLNTPTSPSSSTNSTDSTKSTSLSEANIYKNTTKGFFPLLPLFRSEDVEYLNKKFDRAFDTLI